jgi:hypothetical protein
MAPVPLREPRPFPDVAEQDVVRQFGKLGRNIAHQLLGTRLRGGC